MVIRNEFTVLLGVLICLRISSGLNNGLALTPPMGWMSWLRFGCGYRCDLDPDNCISDRLFRQMADIMADEGFLAAGYEYIAIDDCWMAEERDANGRLQADLKRFPEGIKGLADYVHSRGLKLGIYLNIGTLTCAGYPGSQGHLELDAQTIADWGVDLLKFDGCHANLTDYERDFPAMAAHLNQTGRPIVYSCQWPMYAKYFGGVVDYPLIASTCNMFRALTDIYYNYQSIESMILYFASNPYNMTEVAGPGAWNDPDQISIGNYGMSEVQERSQMAMWAMMASPMIMSNDLRSIRAASRDILLNRNVIAISQDPLGKQASMFLQNTWITVWKKPILPHGSFAIAILNGAKSGAPTMVELSLEILSDIDLNTTYELFEVFELESLGRFKPSQKMKYHIDPTGVLLLKAIPVKTPNLREL